MQTGTTLYIHPDRVLAKHPNRYKQGMMLRLRYVNKESRPDVTPDYCRVKVFIVTTYGYCTIYNFRVKVLVDTGINY